MPLETIQQSELSSNKQLLDTMGFVLLNSLSSFPDALYISARFPPVLHKVFISGSNESLSARGNACFTLRSKKLLIYLWF